jgi:TRAP-type C4-dicarboxylate transport system permease small subunit
VRTLIDFRNLDRDLGVLSLFIMIVLVLAQIVARVVFLAPLVGAEEIVRYLLICIVLLTGGYTVRTGGQIKMEELIGMLPADARRVIRFTIMIVSAAVFAVCACSSVISFLNNLKTATLSAPYWIFFLPNTVGFFLLTVAQVLQVVGFSAKKSS